VASSFCLVISKLIRSFISVIKNLEEHEKTEIEGFTVLRDMPISEG